MNHHIPNPDWTFGRWYVEWPDGAAPTIAWRAGAAPSELDWWVDMERCLTVEEACDWVEHVSGKQWDEADGNPAELLAVAILATLNEMSKRGLLTRLLRKRSRQSRTGSPVQ